MKSTEEKSQDPSFVVPLEAHKTPDLPENKAITVPLVLSEAQTLDSLKANTPYVFKDWRARILKVNGLSYLSTTWVYVSTYDSYITDTHPIIFSDVPTGQTKLIAVTSVGNLSMHSRDQGPNNQWVFWTGPPYKGGNPEMMVQLEVYQQSPTNTTFLIYWQSGQNKMYLTSKDSTSWEWNYITKTKPGFGYSIHKFYVEKAMMQQLFKATWPSSSIYYSEFTTGDLYYEVITDDLATTLFQNTGLKASDYKAEVFDCEDFAYVYKAQASLYALRNSTEYALAVGVIFANSKNSGHAVNFYVDTSGKVKIIEPQNGSIVDGKDWKDSKGAPYIPYFALI